MKKITVKTVKSLRPIFGSESQSFKNDDIIEVWSALKKEKLYMAKVIHVSERGAQIEKLENGAISINSLASSRKI